MLGKKLSQLNTFFISFLCRHSTTFSSAPNKTLLRPAPLISVSFSSPLHTSHLTRPELEKEHKESTSMDPQGQTTSLQRLQNVEKRIVKVLELAGGVMDELASPVGPRKDVVQNHCLEFMQLIKDIQVALRDEIKSACEYRPFEKCDYGSRIANEICHKKVEFIMSQLDAMKQTIDEYHSAV